MLFFFFLNKFLLEFSQYIGVGQNKLIRTQSCTSKEKYKIEINAQLNQRYSDYPYNNVTLAGGCDSIKPSA